MNSMQLICMATNPLIYLWFFCCFHTNSAKTHGNPRISSATSNHFSLPWWCARWNTQYWRPVFLDMSPSFRPLDNVLRHVIRKNKGTTFSLHDSYPIQDIQWTNQGIAVNTAWSSLLVEHCPHSEYGKCIFFLSALMSTWRTMIGVFP